MKKPQATVRFKDIEDRDKFYIQIAKQGYRSLQSWFDSIRNSSAKNLDKSIPKVTKKKYQLTRAYD